MPTGVRVSADKCRTKAFKFIFCIIIIFVNMPDKYIRRSIQFIFATKKARYAKRASMYHWHIISAITALNIAFSQAMPPPDIIA